jgi:hypothetical protein
MKAVGHIHHCLVTSLPTRQRSRRSQIPNKTLRQVNISATLELSVVVFGPPGFSTRRKGRYQSVNLLFDVQIFMQKSLS